MNPLKRFLIVLYKQIGARKNLYHLGDWRVVKPVLGDVLSEAARVWPEVIPWKPRTVLDIGAHRGDVARQFAELYHPEFIGLVEPLPDLLPLLRSMSLAPRQKVFGCALGHERGKAILNVLANAPSSSLLEPVDDLSSYYGVDMQRVATVEVQVRTLDEVFAECELEALDLLKVDVEGYELQVFAGGQETLKRTRLVVVEVVFFEAQKERPLFKDIYAALHNLDFELRGMTGYIYDSRGIPLHCDAVFMNRVLS
ncbi:MAG: hypothetical protein C0410_12920 [Anaerolinea sp.]|nr:hypothetical protein [Anaerolinea sp.]